MRLNDTITAIATPVGSGGIAILRISGEDAVTIASRVVSSYKNETVADFESYKMRLCRVHKKDDEGAVIDQALVVVMRSPRSYTGEDVVEIHCHGGYFVANRILKELLLSGARLAEGGEFTRRAFLNGKTELNSAEAVMDIIDARSELGLENAAKTLNGGLAKEIDKIREMVMEVTAHISAAADYPEEVDAPDRDDTCKKIDDTGKEIEKLLSTFETGRMLREGIMTVIAGRPNVGKSSLLNALSKSDRAIVTDIPGTTRDVIEEYVSLGGVTLRLLDTAGLRDSADTVEKIGIDRAKQYINQADLCLLVIDNSNDISKEDIEIADEIKDKNVIVLLNKSDIEKKADRETAAKKLGFPVENILETATPKGEGAEGLDALCEKVVEMFLKKNLNPGQVCISNERQRDALLKALDALSRAKEGTVGGSPYDLLYIDLEDVLYALGEVTGQTVQEEIIDNVFSRFCVGK